MPWTPAPDFELDHEAHGVELAHDVIGTMYVWYPCSASAGRRKALPNAMAARLSATPQASLMVANRFIVASSQYVRRERKGGTGGAAVSSIPKLTSGSSYWRPRRFGRIICGSNRIHTFDSAGIRSSQERWDPRTRLPVAISRTKD